MDTNTAFNEPVTGVSLEQAGKQTKSDRVVALTKKLLGYGAVAALLGVVIGLLSSFKVLPLSIEQAAIITFGSCAYLLIVAIGAIIVSGDRDRQERYRVHSNALAAARETTVHPVTGDSSIFTPAQWAALASSRASTGIDLSDPATRWRFEAVVRSNPSQVQALRSIAGPDAVQPGVRP